MSNPTKIVCIGAGSYSFGLTTLVSLLRSETLRGSELVLVDRNEEGYCGICSYLRCMSESKGRTSEASRIVTTVADTRMEVG